MRTAVRLTVRCAAATTADATEPGTWIGTKDTTLGQVWTALWNDDGSLAGREPELVQLLPFVAVGLVIALLLARPLNSLALGEELGRALGARIARTRIAAVVAVTLLCGASTAAAGSIGLVGLVVPLVARWLTGPDLRWVLPYSMLLAPVLLVSDIIGRVALPGDELEVGAVTAVIGAPVFIAMVHRRKEASL
ncbi:iron chelate uptake ABC transporter family permease subunit [Streptomyces parvus]|nr:iron chelate uptake ABC transporter family permease subunit [Streptomyces parvus]